MIIIAANNPQWSNAEKTQIDLMVTFDHIGTVPFAASMNDVEQHGRDLFARAVAGEFGSIAEYVTTPPTPEQILAAKKAERQAIVDAIVVTVSTGKVFDGNEEAQSRMSRAIQTAEIAGIESTTWVLANNVPTVVTLPELKEALVLSMQAMGEVWATPYED